MGNVTLLLSLHKVDVRCNDGIMSDAIFHGGVEEPVLENPDTGLRIEFLMSAAAEDAHAFRATIFVNFDADAHGTRDIAGAHALRIGGLGGTFIAH